MINCNKCGKSNYFDEVSDDMECAKCHADLNEFGVTDSELAAEKVEIDKGLAELCRKDPT